MVVAAPKMAAFAGVSDLTYDLLTMLTNKLQCAAALAQYKKDAEKAGDNEVQLVYTQLERHVKEDITAMRDLLATRI